MSACYHVKAFTQCAFDLSSRKYTYPCTSPLVKRTGMRTAGESPFPESQAHTPRGVQPSVSDLSSQIAKLRELLEIVIALLMSSCETLNTERYRATLGLLKMTSDPAAMLSLLPGYSDRRPNHCWLIDVLQNSFRPTYDDQTFCHNSSNNFKITAFHNNA